MANEYSEQNRIEYIRENINPTYKFSKSDAIKYATAMGASDTARGIGQLFGKGLEFFGYDELTDKLKEADLGLKNLFENEEYGTEAQIAFLSSAIVADPASYVPIVGWISKGKKAKNLWDLTKYGTISGASISALGYTPEDQKTLLLDEDANLFQRRLENTAIGGAAGAVIGSAGGAVVDAIQKGRGKGSIFKQPDEIEPKKFADDIVEEDELTKPIKVGSIVRAPDRNNIGNVIDIDSKGVATVRFVNKETGKTATKRFTLDELQPPKPGQQPKSKIEKIEEPSRKSDDIIFAVDKSPNQKTPALITTDDVTKTSYIIRKALDENDNVIKGQWEVIIRPTLRGRKKGESISDFNKRKKQAEEIKVFGSKEKAKKFVTNTIAPNKQKPAKTTEEFNDNVVTELTKPSDEKYTIKNNVLRFYQDKMGEPLKNIIFNNPGESLGAVAGYTFGANSLDDPNATYLEKITAGLVASLAGAASVKYGKNIKIGDDQIKDIFGRAIISDYGLKPDYLKLKQQFRINKNEIGMQFYDIVERVEKDLNPEQRKLLYNFMIGDIKSIEKLSPEALNLNAEARSLITKYANEFKDRGLLDEEVFKKNIDTYLKRTLLKPKADKGTKFYENTNQIRIIGEELKPRGLIEITSKKSFNKSDSVWKKEGWEVIEELKGGKVRVRRDYTKQERIQLEEIEDAGYAIAETGRLFANDIATARFFDDLANDSRFVIDEADYKLLSKEDKSRFTLMPSSKVRGTKKLKYGELSGKYVDKDVLRDIKQMYGFSTVDKLAANKILKPFDKLQTLWKKTKTAWNPATHVGNTTSNVMLLDFADTNISYLGKAYKEMVFNKNSKIHRQAKIDGIFDVDLVSRELGDSITDIEKALKELQGDKFATGWQGHLKSYFNFGKKWSTDKMEKAYQFEDQVFRMAVYMDRLDKGLEPAEAALEARKWFIDYDINAPLIQGLKRTAVPFISYTYRVIPLLAEAAALRPHKFAKWAAFGYALNEGFTYLADDKVGEDIDRITMREQYTKRLFGGAPIVGDVMPYTTIRMPFDDANGNALYFDASRWIPGGDIFEQREGSAGIPGLPSPLQPGGLWVDAIANYMFKVDPFTGQKLQDLGVDEESTFEITKHFAKRLPPNIPFIPGTFASKKWEKAKRVTSGEVEGEQVVGSEYVAPDTPFLALAYGFGFKLRPQDANVNERVKLNDYQREMRELLSKRNKIINDADKGNITPSEEDKQLEKIDEDIITLNAEYELYDAKLRELQSKESRRTKKSIGGMVEGPEVPFTKEDPADRVNPYTGEPYQDQMDRLGFLSGGSTLQSSQNKKYFEEFHNKVLDEGNELVVDGETVTMNIIGVEHKGKEYLIPSYDPATKKILSAKEAKQKYLKDIESGKIKGYNNPEEAEKDRQIFYPQIIRSRDV